MILAVVVHLLGGCGFDATEVGHLTHVAMEDGTGRLEVAVVGDLDGKVTLFIKMPLWGHETSFDVKFVMRIPAF